MINKRTVKRAILILIWIWYSSFSYIHAQDVHYWPRYGDCTNCYLEARRLADSMATGSNKLIIKLDERWKTLSDPEVFQILRLKPDNNRYSIERSYVSGVDFRIPRALRGLSNGFSFAKGMVFFSKYDSSYYATDLETKSFIEQVYKALDYKSLVNFSKGSDTAYSSAKYAKMMCEIKSYSHRISGIRTLASSLVAVTLEVNYLIRRAGQYSVISNDIEALFDSLGALKSMNRLDNTQTFYYLSQAHNPLCKAVYFSLADTLGVQMTTTNRNQLYKFYQPITPYFPVVNGDLVCSSSDYNLKVIYIADVPKQYDLTWLKLSKRGYKQVLAMATIGKHHQLMIEDNGRYSLYKLDIDKKKILTQKRVTILRKPLSNVIYHSGAFHWVSETGEILHVNCL